MILSNTNNIKIPEYFKCTYAEFQILCKSHVKRLFYLSQCGNAAHRAPPWSNGSVLDHRSLPPVFESRRGHIWRLFRLSLRLNIFGSRSAHLAYLVHKSGRKTSIIIGRQLILLRVSKILLDCFHYLCLNSKIYRMWWIIMSININVFRFTEKKVFAATQLY